jgi:hypothetical protein
MREFLELLHRGGVSPVWENGQGQAPRFCVEDEPLIRMGAVSLIEDPGFEVYEAGSAR